jgi:MYXO-CTERM domain-containing protein
MLRAMRRPALWFAFVHLVLVKLAVAGPGPAPILGGTPATVGQYPTVVAIEVGGGLCTGTLITKDWVLTAAHCVTPSVVGEPDQASLTASVKVHFNTVDMFTAPGMVVGASDTIPDPGFDINNLGSHDSGLIKLATPVTTMTPVPLNFIAADAPVGVMVTMVGFGATAVGGGGSVGVEYVVQQMSISCTAQEGTDANLLCFSQVDGKGKCEGDSGGPSFAMINGKLVEVGITSFGDQTCSTFGADTRTDAEKAFLLQHVPELECNTDSDCAMGHECFLHSCIVTPFQPTGLGSTCTTGADCDSGQCASGDGGKKCSMVCSSTDMTSCPSGFSCQSASGGQGACWPNSTGGGCCDTGGAGGPTTMVAGIALVGLVLRRRRRS